MRFISKIQIVFELPFDELNEKLAIKDVDKIKKKIRAGFSEEYGIAKVKVTSRTKELSLQPR
jgi:hypothetical protein